MRRRVSHALAVFALVVVSGGLLSATAQLSAMAQGAPPLLADWTFNQSTGSTVIDSSGNNWTGTLLGDAHFVSGGISGNAVQMSSAGNGLIDFGTSLPSLQNTDFTFSVWVKTAPLSPGQSQWIGGNQYTDSTNNGVVLWTGQVLGNEPIQGSSFYTGTGVATGSTTVDDNGWHQIVGVATASTDYLYVDGKLDATSNGGWCTDVHSGTHFLLGGEDVHVGGVNALQGAYTGLLDDVQIYGGALSGTQVSYLYDHPGQTLSSVPEGSSLITVLLFLLFGGAVVCRQRQRVSLNLPAHVRC